MRVASYMYPAIALAVAFPLAACATSAHDGSSTPGTVDKPVYSTVAELTAAADLVVLGTIGELRGTEIDDGGLGGSDGIPVRFYTFELDDVLAGIPKQDPLVIGWVDNSIGVYDGVSNLKPGEEVVLFLAYRSDEDTPGIETETSMYAVLSDDNGVLDIVGSNAVARSPLVTSMAGPPADRRDQSTKLRFTAPLRQIEAAVRGNA